MIRVPTALGSNEKDKFFLIGNSLSPNKREELAEFLRSNVDVFAWKSYDMPGILAEVMCHKLHIIPGYNPVNQKPRQSALEKARAVEEEVQKLLKARAIKETKFPSPKEEWQVESLNIFHRPEQGLSKR